MQYALLKILLFCKKKKKIKSWITLREVSDFSTIDMFLSKNIVHIFAP